MNYDTGPGRIAEKSKGLMMATSSNNNELISNVNDRAWPLTFQIQVCDLRLHRKIDQECEMSQRKLLDTSIHLVSSIRPKTFHKIPLEKYRRQKLYWQHFWSSRLSCACDIHAFCLFPINLVYFVRNCEFLCVKMFAIKRLEKSTGSSFAVYTMEMTSEKRPFSVPRPSEDSLLFMYLFCL
jgi:hypothetical protein